MAVNIILTGGPADGQQHELAVDMEFVRFSSHVDPTGGSPIELLTGVPAEMPEGATLYRRSAVTKTTYIYQP